MTNKQAIDGIDVIMTDYPLNHRENEALELAIKALDFIEENFPKTFDDYLKGEEI